MFILISTETDFFFRFWFFLFGRGDIQYDSVASFVLSPLFSYIHNDDNAKYSIQLKQTVRGFADELFAWCGCLQR